MWIANRVSHHLARFWALWACFLIAAEITLTELISVLELVLFWANVNACQRSAMYAWEATDSIAEVPAGPSVSKLHGSGKLGLALKKTECVLDVWIYVHYR